MCLSTGMYIILTYVMQVNTSNGSDVAKCTANLFQTFTWREVEFRYLVANHSSLCVFMPEIKMDKILKQQYL